MREKSHPLLTTVRLRHCGMLPVQFASFHSTHVDSIAERPDAKPFLGKPSRTSHMNAWLSLIATAIFLLCSQVSYAKQPDSLAADPYTLREIAFTHYLDNDVEVALDFYEKAVNQAIKEYGAESSCLGDLYYEMGAIAFDSGKFQKAETYLKQAVHINPNLLAARLKLAHLLEVREQPTQAYEQIRQVLAIKSDSREAMQALTLWLIRQKNTAAAIHEAYVMSQNLSLVPRPFIPTKPGTVEPVQPAAANPHAFQSTNHAPAFKPLPHPKATTSEPARGKAQAGPSDKQETDHTSASPPERDS